jgi:hypothetical protein
LNIKTVPRDVSGKTASLYQVIKRYKIE